MSPLDRDESTGKHLGQGVGAGQTSALQSAPRRRLLLKGLGKGGAALVAVAPLKSHAVNRVITSANTLCTQSGQMSNVMSRTGTNVVCGGKGPGYYHNGGNKWKWPASLQSSYDTLTFKSLFPNSTSTSGNTLCKTILSNSPTSNEAYWIAAYFNGTTGGAGTNFPYPAVATGGAPSVQVHHDLWQAGTLTGQQQTYLNLYKNYLSN